MQQQRAYVPLFQNYHNHSHPHFPGTVPRPLTAECPQQFPAGTPLLYFDEKTRSIVSDVPTDLNHYDEKTRSYRAPPGYSFVWLESLSASLSPSPSPVSASGLLVPLANLSLGPRARSRSTTPEKEYQPSKHERIEELLKWLENRFGKNGENIYNQMKQAHGSHVLRIDIKTIKGVQTFPSTLKAICQQVTLLAISTRSSLKRNKQRKGISVYLKVTTAAEKQQAKHMLVSKQVGQPMWLVKEIQPKET